MFPGVDGFAWDAGHIIFLGVFYAVLMVVFSTVGLAMRHAVRTFGSKRIDDLRWHADFEDLPAKARRCRHELVGEVASRVCENGFDCRKCSEHPRFVEARGQRGLAPGEPAVGGFAVPDDRLYHRGHTWVREEPDGTFAIGLDDLGSRLMGKADEVVLPKVGTKLVANGGGWAMRRGEVLARVLAPVDGEVVATGGREKGWYLRVRPADRTDLRHLLLPAEARAWMLREVERLFGALATTQLGTTLADGGTPVDDLGGAIPPERLDEVCGMVFLEP